MKSRKPHIAVFFGGEEGSRDLSLESGYWVCQNIPREKYQITPIHVQPDGSWQVPLGSLPNRGPVDRMMDMLFRVPGQAVRSLNAPEALQRLLQRPLDGMMTLLRGRGGDDGSLHATGQTLGIPVVGSSAGSSQLAHNKHRMHSMIGDFAALPDSALIHEKTPIDSAVNDVKDQFAGPVFVKAVTQDGSSGTELVGSLDELAPAIRRTSRLGDVMVQEIARGTELAVTLFPDQHGSLMSLPTTSVVHSRAPFYDYLAKRRPGRVNLSTATGTPNDGPLIGEAEEIAREVYEELGCAGAVTIDVVADDNTIDVLDVNTIPMFTQATPLLGQLEAARLAPASFLDTLLLGSIDPR